MTRIFWVSYRDKDYDLHTDKYVVTVEGKTDIQIVNTLIVKFAASHQDGDIIVGVEEITAKDVVGQIEDLLKDYRNGTLCFTDDDAEWVGYALTLLKNMEG